MPIINRDQREHLFHVQFDKQCGEDNDCHTDLSLSALLLNMVCLFALSHLSGGKMEERQSICIIQI